MPLKRHSGAGCSLRTGLVHFMPALNVRFVPEADVTKATLELLLTVT